ncbi:hypothetical protein [Caballeronia ptereochthonis]|uniref:hypothetical protein n=1 Tax=Caballeronia ptereochthonis TaxID=1777144 RepID=UPI000B3622A1|nr:hypothetical protein [Caballeronia ptereochthonis]
MTRFAHAARRRFGHVSSTIVNASRHFVPPKLNSWRLALYLIVFLLPGGSFAVLGMGWFENRQRRKVAATAKVSSGSSGSSGSLLTGPCSGGASGA